MRRHPFFTDAVFEPGAGYLQGRHPVLRMHLSLHLVSQLVYLQICLEMALSHIAVYLRVQQAAVRVPGGLLQRPRTRTILELRNSTLTLTVVCPSSFAQCCAAITDAISRCWYVCALARLPA